MRRMTLLVALAFCLCLSAAADMKAKSRMSMQGTSFDSTNYVKGARERREMNMMGFQTTQIYQCDLHRMAMINDKNRTYMITQLGEVEETSDTSSAGMSAKSTKPAPKNSGAGGMITITANSTDTGERKDFFGYKARHVKTSMKTEASADAKCGGNMEMQTDGWYIDFKEQQMICSNNPRAAMAGRGDGGSGCNDKVRIKGSGFARMGYPVSTEMTMMANGQPMKMKQETFELTTATLDPALFEIPPGYKEVHSYRELMGFGGMMNAGKAAIAAAAAAEANNVDGTSTSNSSAKDAGKLRIGAVRFGNSSGQTLSDSSYRERLVSEIQQLGFEGVTLDVSPGSQLSEVQQAAKSAQCDYFVFTDIAQAKDSSGGKKLGGFLSRATGVDSGASTGNYTIGLKFRVFQTGDDKSHLESTTTSSEGTTAEASAGNALEHEALEVGVQVRKDAEFRRRGIMR
jgi:hypothetical protein